MKKDVRYPLAWVTPQEVHDEKSPPRRRWAKSGVLKAENPLIGLRPQRTDRKALYNLATQRDFTKGKGKAVLVASFVEVVKNGLYELPITGKNAQVSMRILISREGNGKRAWVLRILAANDVPQYVRYRPDWWDGGSRRWSATYPALFGTSPESLWKNFCQYGELAFYNGSWLTLVQIFAGICTNGLSDSPSKKVFSKRPTKTLFSQENRVKWLWQVKVDKAVAPVHKIGAYIQTKDEPAPQESWRDMVRHTNPPPVVRTGDSVMWSRRVRRILTFVVFLRSYQNMVRKNAYRRFSAARAAYIRGTQQGRRKHGSIRKRG